jgi:hypothetical protein
MLDTGGIALQRRIKLHHPMLSVHMVALGPHPADLAPPPALASICNSCHSRAMPCTLAANAAAHTLSPDNSAHRHLHATVTWHTTSPPSRMRALTGASAAPAGPTQSLFVLTKQGGQRFEFIFTNVATSDSSGLFSALQAVHRAYDGSRLYRDLKLRGVCERGGLAAVASS